MKHAAPNSRGFTFVELMTAMALGMLVVGLAIKLFANGVDATWVISQARGNAAGLARGAEHVDQGHQSGGCGFAGGTRCRIAFGRSFPNLWLRSVWPRFWLPAERWSQLSLRGGQCALHSDALWSHSWLHAGDYSPGSTVTTDLVTVTYSDVIFALICYNATINSGTSVTFTLPNPLTFPRCCWRLMRRRRSTIP